MFVKQPTQNWKYSGSVTHDRRKMLSNPPPFREIIEKVKNEMKILCGHEITCKDK